MQGIKLLFQQAWKVPEVRVLLLSTRHGARRNPGATQAAASEVVGEGTQMHGALSLIHI